MRAERALVAGIVVAAALVATTSPSAASGDVGWVVRQPSGDRPPTVAAGGDRVFVAGRRLIAYDATTGSELWVSDDAVVEVTEVAVHPTGAVVFATGSSFGPNGWDIVTAAYDAATGAQLWAVRYDGPAHGTDLGYALALSADGTAVFVTGASNTAAVENVDSVTAAYDASTGAELWSRRYDSIWHDLDETTDVAVSHDGERVFVTGTSCCGGANWVFLTVAYDAVDGERLWSARYEGAYQQGRVHMGQRVVVRSDSVFVAGTATPEDTTATVDVVIVAYRATDGTKLWDRTHRGTLNPYNKSPRRASLAIARGGRTVYLGGRTRGDYFVAAYSARTGRTRWDRRYGREADIDSPTQMAISGDSLYVIGQSRSETGDRDYLTVAVDRSSGRATWSRRFHPRNEDDDERGAALAVDRRTQGLYVTGRAPGETTPWEVVTVRYPIA